MTDVSKIDMERINGLLDKLEEVTDKLNSMKYVIETGKSEDGNQWYRKWSDGWIEQGGKISHTTSGGSEISRSIIFPISFSSTTYNVILNVYRDDITPYNPSYYQTAYQIISANTIKIRCQAPNTSQYVNGIVYYVCGF